VADWILAGDGYRIFRPYDGDFVQESILDSAFNLLDFLNSLVMGHTVKEQVDI
jgi:hypothetical protein